MRLIIKVPSRYGDGMSPSLLLPLDFPDDDGGDTTFFGEDGGVNALASNRRCWASDVDRLVDCDVPKPFLGDSRANEPSLYGDGFFGLIGEGDPPPALRGDFEGLTERFRLEGSSSSPSLLMTGIFRMESTGRVSVS
jgi:hypothetical protein